jgi:hypothetical protein
MSPCFPALLATEQVENGINGRSVHGAIEHIAPNKMKIFYQTGQGFTFYDVSVFDGNAYKP